MSYIDNWYILWFSEVHVGAITITQKFGIFNDVGFLM